jgi:hypothetical protein
MMFDVVRMGGKRAGWGRCSRPKCDVIGVWAPQVSPSSSRAQRSNPESFRGGTLDCFAALAMTAGERSVRIVGTVRAYDLW